MIDTTVGVYLHDARSMVAKGFQELQDKKSGGPHESQDSDDQKSFNHVERQNSYQDKTFQDN